ncbi:MAG: hypothetical protein GY816_07435 [Cytophagales bacterium]|nr:hypothetical protein [Cytophagales bacterium]
MKSYLQEAILYVLNQSNRDEFIEAQLIPSIATERRKMIMEKMKNAVRD